MITKQKTNTSEIIDLCNDTLKTSVSTYEELTRQNETLDHANDQLDVISIDLKVADRRLKNMDSIWYRFINYFTPNTPDAITNTPKQKPIIPNQKQVITEPCKETVNHTQQEYIDEQNKDLDHLLSLVSDMKEMSIKTGIEIYRGRDIIGTLDHKTQKNESKAAKLIRDEKKLMND